MRKGSQLALLIQFAVVFGFGQPAPSPLVYNIQPNYNGAAAVFLSSRSVTSTSASRQPHVYIAAGREVRRFVDDPVCSDGRPLTYITDPSHVPGSVASFSYHEVSECRFGRFPVPAVSVRIADNRWIRDQSPGYLRWSSLGGYAALSAQGEARLINMTDGTETAVPSLGPNGRPLLFNGISERGQVLLREPAILPADGSRLYLWEQGVFTELDLPPTASCAIDPQSRYLVCVTDERPLARCLVLDLVTGERKVLDDLLLDRTSYVFRMNATGDRILFQKSLKEHPAGETEIFSMPDLKRTHHLPATGSSVAFSGDGRFLFAGRLDGSLRRFDLETGVEEVWLDPVP